MSYLTQALLTEDVNFGRRSRSCMNQQANVYMADQRPNFVSLARAIITGEPVGPTSTMLTAIAYGAQFDQIVDNGDGTIDQTKIKDADIQSRCDYVWEEVSLFYYKTDGTPV